MNKRSIPFIALGGLWEQDDIAAANRVITAATGPTGNFFPLPEEADFQKALAVHEGCAQAVAVNSCGTALDLCMMALGVKAGDEVIVPGLTFVCTAGAAAARGAKVVFADVDPATLCLSPEAVAAKITPRTKAIIPVHFAGLAADIDGFDRLSQRHGIPVIYDAAHAVGAQYRGAGIGGAGRASCYSFQSNKNMTCLGEGGAVTTNDLELGEKVRGLKTFGYVYGPQLRVTQIGFNYRMTNVCAAIGLAQLEQLDRFVARKREIGERYRRNLDGSTVTCHQEAPGTTHSHWMCSILVEREAQREPLREHLAGCGVETRPVFYPAHTMPMYATPFQRLPVAEDLGWRGINLPSWPGLEDAQVDLVCGEILRFLKSARS